MKIIEAPSKSTSSNKIKIFLAGGISNCENWQKQITQLLKKDKKSLKNITVFNPRRKKMPDGQLKEQIIWEYNKLKESNIILFWFAKGTLNPITLFEYGKYLPTSTKLVVGVDNEYERLEDIKIQTHIIRTSQKINHTIEELYEDLIKTIYEESQNNINI